MPGDRIVIDGLWRCLCPSIEIISSSKSFDAWHVSRVRSASRLSNHATRSKYPQQQCRRQHSQASPSPAGGSERTGKPDKSRVEYLGRLAKRSPWIPGIAFQDPDSFNTKLREIPTRNIYAALKELQDSQESYFAVTRLVEYLVKERGEQPNAALYESLIKANVDRRYGSAKVAARLLKEVQDHNIPTTPELYQALLGVTAVHPDYVLRAQVLHDMKTRWYNLTPSNEITIIIGLLRDGQYELALSKLEALNKNPINVRPWLLDVFLYIFGQLGFHEETLSILKHRQRLVAVMKRAPLSLNAWQFLLDVFGRDAFHPGVKFVWDHSVSPGHIHPPDGVVLNVLNVASMQGDTPLAMSAIQELSARGVALSMHHYEALIHLHARHDDLRKAITILCIMAKAGHSPDLSSTRPIFELLHASPIWTDKALDILHELKVQYTVPAAAFNVVLESLAAHAGFRRAFDLYRTIRQVCINGPDTETFEILFRHCTQRKSMNFLVAEMEAFSLKLTKPILDHSIRICSMQDDYEMAFHYLEIMGAYKRPGSSVRWWMNKNSALALLRRCIQARDPRTHNLLEECRRRRLLDESDIKSLVSIGEQHTDVPQTQSSSSYSPDQDSMESARHPAPSVMSSQI